MQFISHIIYHIIPQFIPDILKFKIDNDNKENMKKVIKQIANKNIKKIYEWNDKYPDCKYSESKKNVQYSRIIIESMSARTIEEDQILYEKIIKNIANETIIDKTK